MTGLEKGYGSGQAGSTGPRLHKHLEKLSPRCRTPCQGTDQLISGSFFWERLQVVALIKPLIVSIQTSHTGSVSGDEGVQSPKQLYGLSVLFGLIVAPLRGILPNPTPYKITFLWAHFTHAYSCLPLQLGDPELNSVGPWLVQNSSD